ncbi:MAG: M23 family metallopeptidase [Variibacter sp.]|nr:M23 family metallopeptidase [Variibacter sp.]
MISFVESSRARMVSRLAAVAAISAGIAGCSSDIGRFNDNPLTGTVATSTTPPAPVGGVAPASYGAPPAYGAPPSYGAPSYGGAPARVESQPLPPAPAVSAVPPPPAPSYQARQSVPAAAPAPRVAAAPAPTAARGAGVHVVARGETLTGIARKYGKSRAEIAQANGIAPDAVVRVGQQLAIPGVGQERIRTAAVAPSMPAAPAPASAPAAASPRAAAPASRTAAQPVSAPASRAPEQTPAAAPAPAPARTAALEPSRETARLSTPATDAAEDAKADQPSATGAVTSFRWPVRGRIIAGFGPKPNGQQNDGINLAVPEGTSIKAAEDGVVAYAGNELKGYGNLVLVRHANGYVTAYAHASELKVKRGDKVKRGQIIALAGQTGDVTSPQLHFEIRKGSTPVDPLQYMSNN